MTVCNNSQNYFKNIKWWLCWRFSAVESLVSSIHVLKMLKLMNPVNFYHPSDSISFTSFESPLISEKLYISWILKVCLCSDRCYWCTQKIILWRWVSFLCNWVYWKVDWLCQMQELHSTSVHLRLVLPLFPTVKYEFHCEWVGKYQLTKRRSLLGRRNFLLPPHCCMKRNLKI